MTSVGIIHVHSTFSYDGKNTLPEIARFAKARGYSFVGTSEHSDTFDESKMTRFVEECRHLSDQSFLMIPGIEFTCDASLHLLALGIERLTEATNPITVARFTRAQGGVAVVSHPSRYHFRIPLDLAAEVHGVEVWNAQYDGRFLPNDRSIVLWKALRARNATLGGFGGQDLHRITPHHRHVTTIVRPYELTRAAILHELKCGNCVISNSYLRIPSSAVPGPIRLNILRALRRGYLTARAVRNFRTIRSPGTRVDLQ